jgi:hypothetical protein
MIEYEKEPARWLARCWASIIDTDKEDYSRNLVRSYLTANSRISLLDVRVELSLAVMDDNL